MPRPPRKISPQILATLNKRPKLRYAMTSKGSKAHSRGDLPGDLNDIVDSLVEATDSNNGQPISLATWNEFHKPKKITNTPLRSVVEEGLVSIISRSKGAFAVRD